VQVKVQHGVESHCSRTSTIPFPQISPFGELEFDAAIDVF